MKCPNCKGELVRSKKDPDYLLCYNCKKKFKVKSKENKEETQEKETVTYSNIPKEAVRKKSEKKVKEDYRKMEEADDDENGGSIVPIIVLGVLIVIVAALIVYMLIK